MAILIIIVAVIAVVILSRSGVSSGIIAMMVPLIFSSLGGLGVGAVTSAVATPFIGIPVGLMCAVYIFSKLVKK